MYFPNIKFCRNDQTTESDRFLEKQKEIRTELYKREMTESKNEEIKKSQTKEKYWIGILVAFTIFQ